MPDAATRRWVHVERQRLKFAAAHMATFGDSLEPLHGHNYAVSIEVEGELGAVGWIVDFGVLKRIGRAICDRLDHHFLLQRASTALGMRRTPDAWEVWFGDRHYRFPAEDVFELPLRNTTAELIAEWIWGEVVLALRGEGITTAARVTIGVEEAPGQAGWYSAGIVAERAEEAASRKTENEAAGHGRRREGERDGSDL